MLEAELSFRSFLLVSKNQVGIFNFCFQANRLSKSHCLLYLALAQANILARAPQQNESVKNKFALHVYKLECKRFSFH